MTEGLDMKSVQKHTVSGLISKASLSWVFFNRSFANDSIMPYALCRLLWISGFVVCGLIKGSGFNFYLLCFLDFKTYVSSFFSRFQNNFQI